MLSEQPGFPNDSTAASSVQRMHADFADQVAIVTGGASGMGQSTAELISQRGGTVIIVDRHETLAREVAASLELPNPLCGDVSDSDFCNGVVADVVATHGRLDVLINAAGVIVRANGEATTDEEWNHVMNVNVNGTFYMCRAAIPEMRQTGGGSIVNFGSIWGELGSAGVAAYCASKGAVHNLTRALAMDLADENIRVNAVCPGEVDTPLLRSERSGPVTDETLKEIASTVPMGRLARPEEIAEVVAFIASKRASYMTGSLVNIDAGYGAR